jgi:hypothetical protein
MIFITGDIHGEIETNRFSSRNWTMGQFLCRDDYLIIAGDFGLLFNNVPTNSEIYWLNWLANKPWTTLFVDGNHENHHMLQALEQIEFCGGTVGKVRDNILHLRRGEIYCIDDKQIFTFGGAHSVDKIHRVQGISWWPEEEPSYAETSYALENLEKHGNKVDIIISHTAPNTIINMLGSFPERANCASAKFLEYIVGYVQFNDLYCGHFHINSDIGKYHLLFDNIVKVT